MSDTAQWASDWTLTSFLPVQMPRVGVSYFLRDSSFFQVVTEQIQLWEAETVRVRYTECNLYEGFESPALYTSAVQFARSQGALLWNDDVERRFAGHCSDHEQIRGFIKSMKDELIRSGDL